MHCVPQPSFCSLSFVRWRGRQLYHEPLPLHRPPPPKKKDLQIALVFLNCDKSMTSGNLRKEKNCLAFTSRSWSTSVRFQGRNLKQKSWREGATCRLALCLLTGSCLVGFFMIPRTNFSGNSAIHSGLGHHTSIPYSSPICWPDLGNSIEDFSSQKKLDCVN